MAIFKENMEAVTPEEKHGLLHKTNILYGAWSALPVFHHWYLGKRWSLAPFSCSLLGMMGVRSVHMPYMWKSCSWRLAQELSRRIVLDCPAGRDRGADTVYIILFIPCSSLVLRLSHKTLLRKFEQTTEISNETGLQNEGSLFVCWADSAEEKLHFSRQIELKFA